MAVDIRAHAQLSAHTASPLPAEEAALYTELLRIRDAVLSGQHPQFKLPPAVIEQLKAFDASSAPGHTALDGGPNGSAFHANRTTNPAQQSSASAFALPGLHTAPTSHVNGGAQRFAAKRTSSSGLDPIFLEKSDSLVRAEGQLKRQRIERDLQTQVEQRKQTWQGRDYGVDAPSLPNITAVLANAFARVSHVSGLKSAAQPGSAASSSFDENDYYSSQVESDWSSPASASKGPDRAAGAHSSALDRNEEPSAPSDFSAKSYLSGKQPAIARDIVPSSSKDRYVYPNPNPEAFTIDDDDDEYTPPDAASFDSLAHAPPLDDDDDDNSEYEPGEITQDSIAPTPYVHPQQPAYSSPHVPIIRNHLTHIAAPQPNRVSPLAVAKGPSIELELVNGRPEIVQKSRPSQHAAPSRVSTASPSGNGAGPIVKKRRQKNKRKRDSEPSAKPKKKRERYPPARSPPSPGHFEPRIKDEPVSPPPFASVSDLPQYAPRPPTYRPAEIEVISPRHAPQAQYVEPPRSGLRYEYAQPTSPAIVRVASPVAYRPVQRDSQDLRRVASLHYAQRPPSPTQRVSSPAPYRTVSMAYGDPRVTHTPAAAMENEQVRYQQQPPVHYVRAERSRSPPRLQEYHDASPGTMPPPTAPPRRIVVDQYGNQYFAADPGPAPHRSSVAPIDRRSTVDLGYERAPSRMASVYAQPVPAQYDPAAEVRMAPPPPPVRRPMPDDQQVQYVDAHGYPVREYSARPAEPQQVRYIDAPTSPVYQAMPRYDQMGPPLPPPAREPTSPVFVPRSYSVRPEEPPQAASTYTRQASVAPVQYMRQESAAPPRAYSHAPQQQQVQQVRYVDQYGRDVPAPEYMYQ